MANSLRTVKVRIDSTKSTAQITKAMYMVSQSKVKRAEAQYLAYKDFMKRIANMVASVADHVEIEDVHPMLKDREVKKIGYLLITSDRGLAGAYNSSTFKALEDEVSHLDEGKTFVCAAIGKQGFSFLRKRKYPLVMDEPSLIRDDVMFIDVVPLAKELIRLYLTGEIDQVVVVYNHYVNSLTQEVKRQVLLPIASIEGEKTNVDYEFESGVNHTLDKLLPMYIEDMIYGIILDAKTSEHSARMNSMKSATDNANEVIEKLQILYNRARQDVITNELIDIIGGANAIGGKN